MGNKRNQGKAAGEAKALQTLQVSKKKENCQATATEFLQLTFKRKWCQSWTTVLIVVCRHILINMVQVMQGKLCRK